MSSPSIACPSCGAPHSLANPGIITVVCEYCGNTVVIDQERLKDLGKQSILPEGFSRLFRGATGTLFQRRFHVLGRVRYSFGHGFWDEWYIETETGQTGWLTEDNHEFAFQVEEPGVTVPAFASLRPGAGVQVKDKLYTIQEKGLAECLGIEGDLPKAVLPGEKYPFADGSTPDGRYTLGIEYYREPPAVYTGRWLKHAALEMDDEGNEW
jgi:hypothetical protein